ncbi:MAG: hypothetical protein D084_Lepto4C00471G0002 [Leptospirillum sp. Group IV 'UBA BS']|nr:MAG: hypothetical protein D084_Lepto4C00471G0002 [Leptospirillum sp. Group IV 'UBA BS']
MEPLTQDLLPLAGTLIGGILTFSGAYLSTALLGKENEKSNREISLSAFREKSRRS